MMQMDYFRRHPSPQRGWVPGNRVEMLENGEEFFPAVFGAIAQAKREVLIETFILFEDKVGLELKRVLVEAAQRGVSVDVLIDDWGSPDLSDQFIGDLVNAGVRIRAFDPMPKWFGIRLHAFRRMHRKIVVVDSRIAFVGGINYSADHLMDFGPVAKQDYAVKLEGPIAEHIGRFARAQLDGHHTPPELHQLNAAAPGGTAEVMFVTRDNGEHRDDIERQYRAVIRSARREVIIANAYFFPGYRLLKTMRHAARRGVRVCLILQGQPDMPIVKSLAELLHHPLLDAKVEIYEYLRRPLHGKIALVDDDWATVGSSNLDPLSLSLNLEANVMIRDRAFNDMLRARMYKLMAEDCRRVQRDELDRRSRWHMTLATVAYHLTRRFPAWAGWLPAHVPRLASLSGMRPRKHEPVRRLG